MNFGDPLVPDRLWSKCIPEPNSGCWLWLGHLNNDGYGTVSAASIGYTTRKAHRFFYQIATGDLAEGLDTDHLCRVRCCVNPRHLRAVTHRTNVLAGDGVAAHFARMTHCFRGHEMRGRNVLRWASIGGKTQRRCRECDRLVRQLRTARTAP